MVDSRHFPQLSPEAPQVWKLCRCDAEETRRLISGEIPDLKAGCLFIDLNFQHFNRVS
jgi:hypothetical protein